MLPIYAAKLLRSAISRRELLAGGLMTVGLTGCGGRYSRARTAYQRELFGQIYAIELASGQVLPIKAENVAFFKQIAPLEWQRVRDQATIDRIVADYNANPGLWREMPPFRQEQLWRPRPEPPLM
jgi:hypothetical protein